MKTITLAFAISMTLFSSISFANNDKPFALAIHGGAGYGSKNPVLR